MKTTNPLTLTQAEVVPLVGTASASDWVEQGCNFREHGVGILARGACFFRTCPCAGSATLSAALFLFHPERVTIFFMSLLASIDSRDKDSDSQRLWSD